MGDNSIQIVSPCQKMSATNQHELKLDIWVGKCSVSVFNHIKCNFSPLNPKDCKLLKLEDCKRSIINHLRQLDTGCQSGLCGPSENECNSEGFLISCRIGHFKYNPKLTVCPLHRDYLGRHWYHPIGSGCLHPDHDKLKSPETLFPITVSMSEYILCKKGLLIPVGSGDYHSVTGSGPDLAKIGMCYQCFESLWKEMCSTSKTTDQLVKHQSKQNKVKLLENATTLPAPKKKNVGKRKIITVGCEISLGPRKKKKRLYEDFIVTDYKNILIDEKNELKENKELTDKKNALAYNKKIGSSNQTSKKKAVFQKRVKNNHQGMMLQHCDHKKMSKSGIYCLKCGLNFRECYTPPRNVHAFCVYCKKSFSNIRQLDTQPCINNSKKHGIYYKHMPDKSYNLGPSKITPNSLAKDKLNSMHNTLQKNTEDRKEAQILVDVKEKLSQMVTFIHNQAEETKGSPVKFFRVFNDKTYVPCDLHGMDIKTQPLHDMPNCGRLEPYPVSMEIVNGVELELSCLPNDTLSIIKQHPAFVVTNYVEYGDETCESESAMYVVRSDTETNAEQMEPYPIAIESVDGSKEESPVVSMDEFSIIEHFSESTGQIDESTLTPQQPNSQFCSDVTSARDPCNNESVTDNSNDLCSLEQNIEIKQEPVKVEKVQNGNQFEIVCKSEKADENCFNENDNLSCMVATSKVKHYNHISKNRTQGILSVKKEPITETLITNTSEVDIVKTDLNIIIKSEHCYSQSGNVNDSLQGNIFYCDASDIDTHQSGDFITHLSGDIDTHQLGDIDSHQSDSTYDSYSDKI